VGEGKAIVTAVVFSLRVNEFDFSFIGLIRRENVKSMFSVILKKPC
jgi:hypothetical protein